MHALHFNTIILCHLQHLQPLCVYLYYVCTFCILLLLYSVYTAYKSILLFVKCLNVYLLLVKRVNCILHCLEHAPKLFTHYGTRAVGDVTIKVI